MSALKELRAALATLVARVEEADKHNVVLSADGFAMRAARRALAAPGEATPTPLAHREITPGRACSFCGRERATALMDDGRRICRDCYYAEADCAAPGEATPAPTPRKEEP